jgi:ubiquinone/menaquinone biosynthesis C-methylase UbiE
MPDVYASIAEAERAVQQRLADVMELRAADPRYQAMLRAYLSEIDFPPGAQVLEIGSGSGSVTRMLARWPNVAHALGVDPSPVFIERARMLAADIANIAFQQADGRSLPLGAESFDAVVINTTLSHVPEPERLVAQAFRVLRPSGWLALFDGDYSTATVAKGEFDPLEACIGAFRTHFVHDAWIVRRLPGLVDATGFDVLSIRSHGYVEAPQGGYMLTWIDRGADVLLQGGCIGAEAAAAMKAEAQRRHAESGWFGHIAFASLIARKRRNKQAEQSSPGR